MKHAIDIAPIGELAEPAVIVRLAEAAEAAGWDGVSTWDMLGTSMGTTAADPFVALAAVASRTARLRLIASVIVLPRRRPHLVAQAAATLDRWSSGRLTLGIGVGADPAEFAAFGDDPEKSLRVARMDEGLQLVDRFLRGEPVEHEGAAFVAHGGPVCPPPVQRPRPPIWLGGTRPGALRRSARWDGWIGLTVSEDGASQMLQPHELPPMVEAIHGERSALGLAAEPFDVALFGVSDPGDERIGRFAAAGATWWLESLSPMRGDLESLLARINAGPPR